MFTWAWEQSLDQYLRHSDEDRRHASFYRRKLAPRLRALLRGRSVRWLEIGPGPGTKTFALLRSMRSVQLGPVDLTMLEPSAHWRRGLKRSRILWSASNGAIKCHLVALPAEEYFRSRARRTSVPWSLVTAIHVTYDWPVVGALASWAGKVPLVARPVFVVIAESPRSDFARIRRVAARRLGVHMPQSFVSRFRLAIEGFGYRTERYEIAPQHCRVPVTELLDDDSHWLFSLLLGKPVSSWGSAAKREAFRGLVHEFVRERAGGRFSVPDAAVVAYPPRRLNT